MRTPPVLPAAGELAGLLDRLRRLPDERTADGDTTGPIAPLAG
jgi:hypothetical protein